MSGNASSGGARSEASSRNATPSLQHATNFPALKDVHELLCTVQKLSIPVGAREKVPGFLHLPANYSPNQPGSIPAAAILLSGAGGGLTGPSAMYLSMGDKLASLQRGVPVLRLDYRYPADTNPCVKDVISAMDYMEETYSINRFVLVGWSFGGAPVFTVGGRESERVVGCATVASQTAATSGIRYLPPRPVLLLHGTGDATLSHRCSQNLYDSYGPTGDRTLKLFPGDNHALSKNSLEAEVLLCNFIAKCVGLKIEDGDQDRIVGKPLVPAEKKVPLMQKGGDLKGEEKVE
ncbi:hypothetical protein LTS13_003325 [Exophiala xenobiotica]|nr:hypothetical protein LTR92_000681 [Exophiala xenobiotica]KAK5380467.1 hypothetical protein LTS13_003325 [Exophiala xenobiotica]KAK5393135.1 hypothetical protein LTR79_009449 [Exophiala xenobiotica]KAK5422423.1 hypothetical protein LTR06_000681 [Exophiala xenobiotica]KAK5447447.1 hypothetical protein LTR18_003027 [Exophiala xenobiotica]